MRVIIAGSRFGVKYTDVEDAMALAAQDPKFSSLSSSLIIDCIVCGMAEGADILGKAWAEHRSIRVWEMPADWESLQAVDAHIVTRPDGSKYNMRAGHDRNQTMVDVAHAAVFIRRKGKSGGTDDCIKRAKKKGIPVYVHMVG